MKEKIVTENAEIEVLANGEAISLCMHGPENGGSTVCSWLDADRCFFLASTLLDALLVCYPDQVDRWSEDELDGEEDDLESEGS